MRHFACVFLGVFLGMPAAGAEEYAWRLSTGVTYRHFGDAEVEPVRLRNHATMMTPGGPFGIQGYSVLPGLADGSGVTADRVRFGGIGESMGWQWGPTVSLHRDVWRSDDLSLQLGVNLSYFSMDSDFGVTGNAGAAGRFAASHYNYLVAEERVLAPPLNDAPLAGFSPGTSATLRLRDFELDLWVLDVGLRGQADFGNLYLSMALGPVLYLADAESSLVEGGAWNAIPGTGDPGQYRQAANESDFDSTPGVFVSIGAGIAISERLTAEIELRWDDAFDDVGTSRVTVDLDGVSGTIRLAIGF